MSKKEIVKYINYLDEIKDYLERKSKLENISSNAAEALTILQNFFLYEKENSELEEKMKKEAEQYCELCRSYFFKCDLENLNASKNKELIELAQENIDKAIELNPSCADYYDISSQLLSLAGYDNEALRNAFIASMLRNP